MKTSRAIPNLAAPWNCGSTSIPDLSNLLFLLNLALPSKLSDAKSFQPNLLPALCSFGNSLSILARPVIAIASNLLSLTQSSVAILSHLLPISAKAKHLFLAILKLISLSNRSKVSKFILLMNKTNLTPRYFLFYFILFYFILFYFILFYFILLFYYFIILLFYYFIILLFYYFIILLF